ncbi:hypothetical protein C2857_006318 [Epichloe festucae Fl1]|uniref:Uncharacterized protein n=1 Tax=Epichloe festucae (strain Fl1) TaxID=877507 RepID=A0A7S9PUE1_EPIFF|nr:hypothetical protein C2857_006318 [Epichloe festucae Fl1]
MALATPAGVLSDFQADLQAVSIATTRQEPEAVSLDKRKALKIWFKIPTDTRFSETEVLLSGISVLYVMASKRAQQHGKSVVEYFCQSLTFMNATAKSILITVLTDANKEVGKVELKSQSVRSISILEEYSGEIVKAMISDG